MEHYIYSILAAFTGALAYFLLRRRGPADTSAAAGSAFAKYGPNVRLRDVFRLAVMLEEKGTDLYLRMEKAASDPDAKKLCAWLAEQETQHRRLIQDTLDRWRPLHPHLTEWPEFLRKVESEGFFSAPPPPEATEKELVAFAIRQEMKSAEFYAALETSFPEAWKQARLRRLVEEERSHLSRLREAYPGS
ncbi:MAG: ferritin family protein [Elusimicrobia bacterium]|nr:ferritin family protein [Elusimicrobiota bacterium]